MRWLEWGTRSYENFAYVMGLAGLTYLLQGWFAGVEGISPTHALGIVPAEVLNAVWMTSLLVVASRMPQSASASPRR
jgi:hypothetical protein